MKIRFISFLKSAIMPFFVCAGAVTILLSCEPEAVDAELVEMNLQTKSDMKASMADLPHKEIAQLRRAVAPYHRFDAAYEAGYQLEVTGYRNQMGFHYLNPELLDGTFELTKPELLLFVPAPNGKLRFVGVEYAVPIEDINNPPPAPEGFTGDADQWVINTEFNLWVLHAWVGQHNPDGIFASRNPRIP